MARLVWNMDAFYQLRSSRPIQKKLESVAKKVAKAANSSAQLDDNKNYVVGSRQGSRRPAGRWRASVVTASGAAMKDNAKNHRLLRSLDAGRG